MGITEACACSWQSARFSTSTVQIMALSSGERISHFLTTLIYLAVEVRPEIILNAEKELGIVAGLQNRLAQVYGGLVYMDFSKKYIDELGHGKYIQVDIGLLSPLYLI